MRYYSTQRPIAPGTFPKSGYKINSIVNFDSREYVPEINRPAYGYIEYDGEISEADASNYELIKA